MVAFHPTVSSTWDLTEFVCPMDGYSCIPKSSLHWTPSSPSTTFVTEIPPTRHVTFFVDELDRDLVEVLEYEAPEGCDKADLYWSEDEKSRFCNEAWLKVQDFLAHYPDRAQQVEAVFINCQANCSSGQAQSEQECQDDMRVLLLWAHSSGRGLEDSVTSLFHQERQGYIQNLVRYSQALGEYAAIQDEPVIHVPEELRRYSEEQTHQSREFAFKLALADELTQQRSERLLISTSYCPDSVGVFHHPPTRLEG
jgi:hypothetical protein